jgi:hypothetical protein
MLSLAAVEKWVTAALGIVAALLLCAVIRAFVFRQLNVK